MVIIDKHSHTPAYRQLFLALRSDIENGVYRPGAKLPALRTLAGELGIARNTVEAAYTQLVKEGYLCSRRGSGYVVNDLDFSVLGESRETECAAEPRISSGADLGANPLGDNFGCTFDFCYGNKAGSSFPCATWRALTAEALSGDNIPGATSYSDRFGLPGLREHIARYLKDSRNITCSPRQIVLQAGTQEALHNIVTLVDHTQRRVAMEDPGYSAARSVFSSRSCQIDPMPVYKGEPDFLSALDGSNARLLYVTPSNQFPTGSVMPLSSRLKVIEWASDNDSYVIEDDYCSEFCYDGSTVTSLFDLDRTNHVIYLGTFSKILSPALRLSFIVLPPALIKRWSVFFPNYLSPVPWLSQEVLRLFFEHGHWQKFVNKTKKDYRERHDLLLGCIETELGGCFDVMGTSAGLHVLLGARDQTPQQVLIDRARANDVRVYGTSQYWMNRAHPLNNYVLLGYSSIENEMIPEGIARLRRAWLS